MPTLQEALDVIAAHGNPAEVVQGLHEKAQKVWQLMFDKGHGVATDNAKIKYDALVEEKRLADEKITALDRSVTELKAKSPDLAKIHEEHAQEILKIKKEHKDELDGFRSKTSMAQMKAVKADLKARLTKVGIVGKYADTLLADEDTMKRITLRDDGSVSILQKGKSIELVAAEGKSNLDLLADELFQETKVSDPDMIRVTADDGTGLKTGQQGAQAGSEAFYAKIREDKQKEEKASTTVTGEAALLARSGMTPAT